MVPANVMMKVRPQCHQQSHLNSMEVCAVINGCSRGSRASGVHDFLCIPRDLATISAEVFKRLTIIRMRTLICILNPALSIPDHMEKENCGVGSSRHRLRSQRIFVPTTCVVSRLTGCCKRFVQYLFAIDVGMRNRTKCRELRQEPLATVFRYRKRNAACTRMSEALCENICKLRHLSA